MWEIWEGALSDLEDFERWVDEGCPTGRGWNDDEKSPENEKIEKPAVSRQIFLHFN